MECVTCSYALRYPHKIGKTRTQKSGYVPNFVRLPKLPPHAVCAPFSRPSRAARAHPPRNPTDAQLTPNWRPTDAHLAKTLKLIKKNNCCLLSGKIPRILCSTSLTPTWRPTDAHKALCGNPVWEPLQDPCGTCVGNVWDPCVTSSGAVELWGFNAESAQNLASQRRQFSNCTKPRCIRRIAKWRWPPPHKLRWLTCPCCP